MRYRTDLFHCSGLHQRCCYKVAPINRHARVRNNRQVSCRCKKVYRHTDDQRSVLHVHGNRTRDRQISNLLLYPTELTHRVPQAVDMRYTQQQCCARQAGHKTSYRNNINRFPRPVHRYAPAHPCAAGHEAASLAPVPDDHKKTPIGQPTGVS